MGTTLAELSARALAREASQPIIEFEGRWVTWGEMRHVSERVGSFLDASGAPPSAPVALVARNRPSSVAALLGLIATSHSIRMVHPFQSAASMARDLERLKPAALVGAAEEFSDEVRSALRKHGIAAVAISDMDATAVVGFERCESHEIEVPAYPQIQILTSGTTGPPKHFAISFE